ncbi:hypothetical protein TUM19329_18020 [Legionella antarctica]|uniref:Uncharacterized protein n=1 Tax=Legionella antarctica TaxID=2708020 RepID=A0A6F8T4Q2_9GAMM|nr:hypothetical protein TUM19329_18020 [Legionella antarctica]
MPGACEALFWAMAQTLYKAPINSINDTRSIGINWVFFALALSMMCSLFSGIINIIDQREDYVINKCTLTSFKVQNIGRQR